MSPCLHSYRHSRFVKAALQLRDPLQVYWPAAHLAMTDQVTLNVGGQTFDTTRSTLTKDPHSMLAKIAMYDLETHSAFIDPRWHTFPLRFELSA